MIRRSLREWELIAYGNCEHTIPEDHTSSLVKVAKTPLFAGAGGAG